MVGYEQEGLVPFVVDAVYAMARALHNLIFDRCSSHFESDPLVNKHNQRRYTSTSKFESHRESPNQNSPTSKRNHSNFYHIQPNRFNSNYSNSMLYNHHHDAIRLMADDMTMDDSSARHERRLSCVRDSVKGHELLAYIRKVQFQSEYLYFFLTNSISKYLVAEIFFLNRKWSYIDQMLIFIDITLYRLIL